MKGRRVAGRRIGVYLRFFELLLLRPRSFIICSWKVWQLYLPGQRQVVLYRSEKVLAKSRIDCLMSVADLPLRTLGENSSSAGSPW